MLMAEQTSKRIAIASDVRDRISNLPNGIIDHILDFLLVRDAARTSILSRKWRYVWASHPSIVLHPDRFEDGKVMVRNKFVSIITGIVLQHIGPIQKFSLKFPPIGSHTSSSYSRVDHLLLFLSRNGIRDITLHDPNAKAYGLAGDSELQTLPTTCSSLKHLVVRHIKFGDIHQISLILCLLRSSPFLTKLEISVDFSAENAAESVSNYLSEPQCKVGITENLQTLTIESFNGTKAELLFVKLLLSCSPRLKTVAVQESRSFSHNEILSISKWLMRLPRASKEAVIVFEPDVKIPTYDDALFTGVL